MNRRVVKALLPLAVCGLIALTPAPAGLAQAAWFYFALFAGVVAGLILEPLPAPAVGLIGVTTACLLRLVEASPDRSIAWALGGFGHPTVWLIFTAFMFALGYEKSGLGRRLALLLVRTFGHRTLGLGYAVALADLLLAPFMPSNTARSGGTIFPVIRNIPPLYNQVSEADRNSIGAFLMWTALATTCVTSSLFMTALAPNLLALDLVQKSTGITLSWSAWLLGFLPAGVVLLPAVPFISYRMHAPGIAGSREVPAWAAREIAAMGLLRWKEVTMAGLVLLALGFWILAPDVVHAAAVALGVLCLMVGTGIVQWEDVLSNRSAWNVLVWFATLVTLADGLTRLGFTPWLGSIAAGFMTGLSPTLVMLFLVALFFISHYLFASVTAHTVAMVPVFVGLAAALPGINLTVFAHLLCYSLGLMGILTPYGTGPSPIYYASGYFTAGEFWKSGALFGGLFLAALLGIALPTLLTLPL